MLIFVMFFNHDMIWNEIKSYTEWIEPDLKTILIFLAAAWNGKFPLLSFSNNFSEMKFFFKLGTRDPVYEEISSKNGRLNTLTVEPL